MNSRSLPGRARPRACLASRNATSTTASVSFDIVGNGQGVIRLLLCSHGLTSSVRNGVHLTRALAIDKRDISVIYYIQIVNDEAESRHCGSTGFSAAARSATVLFGGSKQKSRENDSARRA
jgi:hypothetical protein